MVPSPSLPVSNSNVGYITTFFPNFHYKWIRKWLPRTVNGEKAGHSCLTSVSLAPMRILLVDDEQVFVFILGEVLRGAGYAVATAEDGQAARTLLEQGTFDCIISDVYMPHIDGFQLYEYVRSSPVHRNVPFIFLTGADHHETRSFARDTKLDAVLVKTAPVEQIVACIEQFGEA